METLGITEHPFQDWVFNIHSCSEHETVKLKILREVSKTNSRITTLVSRRVDFRLFTDLLGRIPWETGLEANKPKQASWYGRTPYSKHKKWTKMRCRKLSRDSTGSAWRSGELLTQFKCKKHTERESQEGLLERIWRHCSSRQGWSWENQS